LGRLNYRTSYGQNVLTHSIEVAYFAEMLANELNLDSEIAKKAGLLHDIGKAIDHEVEGDHLNLGIKILQKYKIDERIILAMRSHHEITQLLFLKLIWLMQLMLFLLPDQEPEENL